MDRIPFDASEMQVMEEVGLRKTNLKLPIYNYPMSSKEHYKRVVKGEKPLWIPFETEIINFSPHIVPDNVARGLVLEGKPYPNPENGAATPDMFGTPWYFEAEVGGSMTDASNPLFEDANEWKEKVVFPDIDSWDWEGSAEENKEFISKDRPLLIWQQTGMYERLISFMGFENAAMAMIDEDQQDAVKELYDALADLYCRLIEKYKKYYNIDIIYFHDDWGAQRSPFFSLDTAREMLVPYFKKITDKCHELDVIFEFHSCGRGEMLTPAMIEAGMDVWMGQNMNDKDALYANYGNDILIGVVPDDLPLDATDEECYEAAKKYVERFMAEGKEGRIYGDLRVCPIKYHDYIYELSRKALNP